MVHKKGSPGWFKVVSEKNSIVVQPYNLFDRANIDCSELTGELGLPLAKALLLHGVEV